MKLGIDIGSTTVKFVLLDRNDKIVFSRYERHMSNVFEKVYELMLDLYNTFKDIQTTVSITGSGGLSFSSLLEIPSLLL
jgi:activator of 2-hydroxyglutaryl-CoA dehydratase